MSAAKIVNASIIGKDFETVFVNGNAYIIKPPTINKIAGAGYYLSDLAGETLLEMLNSFKDMKSASNALSWFIQGNEKLSKELANGTMEEITEALSVAISMISAENFYKLSALARSVANLTAKQRP